MESTKLKIVKPSEWKCYLFGSKPEDIHGMIYQPVKGNVPNLLIRYLMKICLGCTWVKNNRTS